MVCPEHFVDREPTLQSPNPTLDLGYEIPTKKTRRTLLRKIKENSEDDESINYEPEGGTDFAKSANQDNDYCCKSDP